MPYYIYILKSTLNELDIGQTNDLQARKHQQTTKSSKAAKFVKDGKDFRLIYQESYPTRLEAMRREKQLKGWGRAKKGALIKGDLALLKKL